MSLTAQEKKIAEHISLHSRLPLETASHIYGAWKNRNLVQLIILVEKHLLTGEQSETLKDNGLTVSDVVLQNYDLDSYAVVEWIIREWNVRLAYNLFDYAVAEEA